MEQMNLFSLTDDLPEKGDILHSNDGEIHIVGIRESWSGVDTVLWTVGSHRKTPRFLKGASVEEFQEKLSKGEFWW